MFAFLKKCLSLSLSLSDCLRLSELRTGRCISRPFRFAFESLEERNLFSFNFGGDNPPMQWAQHFQATSLLGGDDEWSGIAYHKDGQGVERLVAVTNQTPRMAVFNLNGTGATNVTLQGFRDVEGITWMGGSQFAILEERDFANSDPAVSILTFDPATVTTVNKANATTQFTLPALKNTFDANLSPEGIAYDETNNRFFIAKERNNPIPPATPNDVGGIYTVSTNGTNLQGPIAFPVIPGVNDYSDVFYSRPFLYVTSEQDGVGDLAKVDVLAPTPTMIGVKSGGDIPADIEGVTLKPNRSEIFIVTDGGSPDYRSFCKQTWNFDASDGCTNEFDLDELRTAFGMTIANPNYSSFNVNGVGTVIDEYDRNYFVHRILETTYGDANLDRKFNSSDWVAVFQAGEYDDAIPFNSTWPEGDWNGDRDAGTSDLVVSQQDGCYDQGLNCVPVLADFNP